MTPNRRKFLQTLATLPGVGALLPASLVAKPSKSMKRDIYKELGVRPLINAAGTYTTLSASTMHKEVVEAVDAAARQYVNIPELHEAVGKKIAAMLQCEGALVTCGAASALTLGTAACVAGKDQAAIRRLPDLTGLKNEVLIQKTHRYGYDHAVRNVGIKMIEVETSEELQRAASDRTAMMLFFNANEPKGQIKGEEFVQLGKKLNVPTFNDAAADCPPVENLMKYTKMGFDLVTFSGGKGLFGPQCSGLLLGRKDLIEAGKAAISPSGGIGRGMKVGKEEMIGVLAAVERYLKVDHDAERRELEDRAAHVLAALAKVSGVKAEKHVPEIANNVPHVKIEWEGKRTAREVVKQLLEGEPSIAVSQRGERGLMVSMWTLRGDEHMTVARRLREVLT